MGGSLKRRSMDHLWCTGPRCGNLAACSFSPMKRAAEKQLSRNDEGPDELDSAIQGFKKADDAALAARPSVAATHRFISSPNYIQHTRFTASCATWRPVSGRTDDKRQRIKGISTTFPSRNSASSTSTDNFQICWLRRLRHSRFKFHVIFFHAPDIIYLTSFIPDYPDAIPSGSGVFGFLGHQDLCLTHLNACVLISSTCLARATSRGCFRLEILLLYSRSQSLIPHFSNSRYTKGSLCRHSTNTRFL
jgi:hypothetical protein